MYAFRAIRAEIRGQHRTGQREREQLPESAIPNMTSWPVCGIVRASSVRRTSHSDTTFFWSAASDSDGNVRDVAGQTDGQEQPVYDARRRLICIQRFLSAVAFVLGASARYAAQRGAQ